MEPGKNWKRGRITQGREDGKGGQNVTRKRRKTERAQGKCKRMRIGRRKEKNGRTKNIRKEGLLLENQEGDEEAKKKHRKLNI